MGKIYEGQTAVKITVTTDVDITGVTPILKYKKPSGTLGSFTTNINVVSIEEGVFSWVPADANALDEVGTWTFWAYVTYTGGDVAAGEPFCVEIYKQGK